MSPEAIEANQNKLDLRPNLAFVEKHLDQYKAGIAKILNRPADPKAIQWADAVQITGSTQSTQLSAEQIRSFLSRMPSSLRELSHLKEVAIQDFILVPGFDEHGNFDSSKVTTATAQEFPTEGEHPSRILVGWSDGQAIRPTIIPDSVSSSPGAIWIYQAHVFLHEFFHTIEFPRRTESARSAVSLALDGIQFTFQDWWQDFEQTVLNGQEPEPVSMYAATRQNLLNQESKLQDPQNYLRALAEQVCESFVAHQLGIISNSAGWTDFRAASLGNKHWANLYDEYMVESANQKWGLMERLCRAAVI